MARKSKFSQEVCERAVRMVLEHGPENVSEWEAMRSIAGKIGCTAETAMLIFQNRMAVWLHHQRVIEHIDDLGERNRIYFDGILRRAYSDPLTRLFYENAKGNFEQYAVAYVDAVLARSVPA